MLQKARQGRQSEWVEPHGGLREQGVELFFWTLWFGLELNVGFAWTWAGSARGEYWSKGEQSIVETIGMVAECWIVGCNAIGEGNGEEWRWWGRWGHESQLEAGYWYFSRISQISREISCNINIKEECEKEKYWKPADENEKSRWKVWWIVWVVVPENECRERPESSAVAIAEMDLKPTSFCAQNAKLQHHPFFVSSFAFSRKPSPSIAHFWISISMVRFSCKSPSVELNGFLFNPIQSDLIQFSSMQYRNNFVISLDWWVLRKFSWKLYFLAGL